MSNSLYLLDTSVILALVRGQELGNALDNRFGLRAARQRALASIVSVGELRVLAGRNAWGDKKTQALQRALEALVIVDISHPAVIDAYVAIELASQAHPEGSRNLGKNDLWIAACARAAGATLLTYDHDFKHLIPDMLAGHVLSLKPAEI